jgi:integrase/recombinase XerC
MEIDNRGGHCVVVYKGARSGRFRAVCHSSADPAADPCWTGPTRSTPAEATFDGRGHHFGPEPFIDRSVTAEGETENDWLSPILHRLGEYHAIPDSVLPPAPSVPYAEYLLGQGKSAKTVREYEREVTLALTWFESLGLDLANAIPSQLQEYAETRPNTPSVRAHLRSALRHWWEWQQLDGWPNAIDVPAPARMVCKALTEAETQRLVHAARGWWREGTAVLVGIHLGLRNAELRSMRWDGFDPSMEWYSFIGKGNKERTVAVSDALLRELEPHRLPSGFVFEGRFGGPVSHGAIWNWVRAVAREAGVTTEVWPHRLRHTFGATALDETGDLRAVQDAMGHARPETTAGYTRATAARLRKVADAVARGVSIPPSRSTP